MFLFSRFFLLPLALECAKRNEGGQEPMGSRLGNAVIGGDLCHACKLFPKWTGNGLIPSVEIYMRCMCENSYVNPFLCQFSMLQQTLFFCETIHQGDTRFCIFFLKGKMLFYDFVCDAVERYDHEHVCLVNQWLIYHTRLTITKQRKINKSYLTFGKLVESN